MNDLRDKARRAFYAIKRNITFDIPIRIWLKILESVIELYDSPNNNSQNGTNTKLRICMQNSAKISSEYNIKHQIMHAEQN